MVEIYIRTSNGEKRAFSTIEAAEKYIGRILNPGGNCKSIWKIDEGIKTQYASYRKDKTGKVKKLQYEAEA